MYVAKHISNVFRAKTVEKKQENVKTQKIKPQIFLDVAVGRNANSQLGYKAVIFWWVWAMETAKALQQGGGSIWINIGSNSIQNTVIWALSPSYIAQPEPKHLDSREAPEEVGLWVCATPREGRLSLCLSGMALLRASFNTNSQNRQKYSLAHVRASVKQSSCISQVSITVTKHQDR